MATTTKTGARLDYTDKHPIFSHSKLTIYYKPAQQGAPDHRNTLSIGRNIRISWIKGRHWVHSSLDRLKLPQRGGRWASPILLICSVSFARGKRLRDGNHF